MTISPANSRELISLDQTIRLILMKFIVKTALVPSWVPRVPVKNPLPQPVPRGVEILPPTPDTWLSGLRGSLLNQEEYLLVGAKVTNDRIDKRSDVLFTFCRAEYAEGPFHPNFADRFEDLAKFLIDLTQKNTWSVHMHRNLHYGENGEPTGYNVLDISSAHRTAAFNEDGSPVMVYLGGRKATTAPDQFGHGFKHGVGPRVPLINRSNELRLVDGSVVFLPKPVYSLIQSL